MKQLFTIAARSIALMGFVLPAACGAPNDADNGTDAELGEVQQEIKNGTVIDANYSGYVELITPASSPWTFCSGTFVTNQWVVTAKHCVLDPNLGPGDFLIRMGNQTLPVVLVLTHPSSQEDIAMVATQWPAFLRTGVTTGVTNSGFRRSLDTRSAASLDGQTLLCKGYGPGQFQPALRQASLTADNLGGAHPLCMLRNSLGQMQEPGDSGGGCIRPTLVGIPALTQTNSYCQQTFCCGDPAIEWAEWVNNVIAFFGG